MGHDKCDISLIIRQTNPKALLFCCKNPKTQHCSKKEKYCIYCKDLSKTKLNKAKTNCHKGKLEVVTPWGIFNHHNLFVRSLEWKLASIVFMCGCSVSILVLVGLIWRNLILLFVLVNICAGRSYLKKSNVSVRVTFGCSLWCTSIIRCGWFSSFFWSSGLSQLYSLDALNTWNMIFWRCKKLQVCWSKVTFQERELKAFAKMGF